MCIAQFLCVMKTIPKEAGGFGAAVKTTAPSVADPVPPRFQNNLALSSLAEAEWLRLPPPKGRCRLSGLSRTTLLELGERGLIKLVRLRKPGATKGIVLIQKASLLDFLASLPVEGEEAI
jgi:hypothetical protein